MVWFYIALYPVRWTAQSALNTLSSPGRPVHSDTVLGFSWNHSLQFFVTLLTNFRSMIFCPHNPSHLSLVFTDSHEELTLLMFQHLHLHVYLCVSQTVVPAHKVMGEKYVVEIRNAFYFRWTFLEFCSLVWYLYEGSLKNIEGSGQR